MAVRTTRSPGDGDMCIIQAEGCRVLTDRWWGDGCITVCSNCSVLPTTTDALLRDICKRDGWGPIPPENTDVGGPSETSPA